MSIVAYRKVVIARVKNIAAFFGGIGTVHGIFIIGGKEIVVSRYGNNAIFACGKFSSLCKAYHLYGRLLSLSILIGKACIELHHALRFAGICRTVCRTVVCNFYFGNNLMILPVPLNGLNFLRELRIGKSVAVSICHFFGIVPAVAGACIHACAASCIIYAEHLVVIARFVILIADVNVFRIHYILIFILCVVIGKSEVAEVAHCGGRHGICCICIGKMA